MKLQYTICNNEWCLATGQCSYRMKIHTCLQLDDLRYQKRKIFVIGSHNSNESTKKIRGISSKTKEVFENMNNEFDCKPKRIHIRLQRIDYESLVDVIPTLLQLQNYISNRRKDLGNENDVSEFSKYAKSLTYRPDITSENSLFVFGPNFGNGSDENHFRCGFTSQKLLMQLNEFKNQGVFHIDSTYKIVKYAYPLIVFGFTDIQHIFHPLCYMFTSHEEEADFSQFFEKFMESVVIFQLNFKPLFIISDACHAMANAIKTHLPHCTYLMCYFHLKYNIRKHKKMIRCDK